jgi:pyridoxamine 5'-phosphate oxidase
MMNDIAGLRKEYMLHSLKANDMPHDPLVFFEQWFKEALVSEVLEANAMALCTVDPKGRPSTRIVLLKGVEDGSYVFYTNYHSNKGQMITLNPNVALTFFWAELERQVRIEGVAEKVSEQVSDAYFASRPRGSQIGAWVSEQSEVIDNELDLSKVAEHVAQRFEGMEVIRPQHWGGYAVKPEQIEFWQGRPNRLHDRMRYTLQSAENTWQLDRLSP